MNVYSAFSSQYDCDLSFILEYRKENYEGIEPRATKYIIIVIILAY